MTILNNCSLTARSLKCKRIFIFLSMVCYIIFDTAILRRSPFQSIFSISLVLSWSGGILSLSGAGQLCQALLLVRVGAVVIIIGAVMTRVGAGMTRVGAVGSRVGAVIS